MSLPFTSREKDRHKEALVILRQTTIQQKQTWLCFLQSPRLVPHVGPLRDSHSPHRGGLIQESVAAGERCVCLSVGVVVSLQHPQPAPVSREETIRDRKFSLFFPPSGLLFSSLLFSSQDCVRACVHVWGGRLRVLSVSGCECACECARACVSSRMVTVCHTGRRAGGQAALCALHYCCDDWNQLRGGVASQATHTYTSTHTHPHTHIHTHTHTHINTPPPTAASQFTLTNTSWTMVRWTVPLWKDKWV